MGSISKKTRLLAVLLGLVMASAALTGAFPGGRRTAAPGQAYANGFEAEDITEKLSERSSDKYVTTAEGEARPLSDDDWVWVIVEADGAPLLDLSVQSGAASVREYAETAAGVRAERRLLEGQAKLKNRLSGAFDVNFKHSYTTLLSGFAAEVRYGDVERLRAYPGVAGVIVAEQYAAPKTTDATENDVKVYGTGIYDSSDVGYTGAGTVAAVLDTGLDYTHSAFQDQPEKLALDKDAVAGVLADTAAAGYTGGLSVDDVYVSDKVPFAYDYADKDPDVYPREDHGTHVAGIIAGRDSEITGVAVDAQLAIMKVFSNYDTGANTVDILAALSDAVLLNVDVINLSLGTSCGFSDYGDDKAANEIYEKVRAAGISLIVAASNDYSAAKGSDYGDFNLLENPDAGTVGAPASLDAALAVASISGVKSKYALANGATPVYLYDASDAYGEKSKFVEKMLGGSRSAEYEYVAVPGVGRSGNYTGLNVAGKIALVQRGIISFEEKVRTAAAFGAAGVIIYNDVSGNINISTGTFNQIPAAMTTMDIGNAVAKNPEGKLRFDADYLAGPFMSDFSSWGVLPNLELKPEITAHGGEIYSAVPGGYDRISGTSMAAPNMAGATTLVRQYIKERFPNLTNVEVTNLAYQLMMSTARPALNEDGNPYSPRKQGAGLAAIEESVKTPAYLYAEGSNKTKLSLGDDPKKGGVYTLRFKLKNITANALSYRIETDVLTESVSSDEKTVAERSYMLNDTASEVSVRGGSYDGTYVSVSGYAEAEITVKLTLSASAKEYLDKTFKNGMFVEGFCRLESDNADRIGLSIPWVSFYGDWTQAPLLDYTAYEITESYEDSSILEKDKLKSASYASIPMGAFRLLAGYDANGQPVYQESIWGLGDYGYKLENEDDKPRAKEDKASVSTRHMSTFKVVSVWLGTLRGAKTVNVEVIDAFTGEAVYRGVKRNVNKSYANNGATRVPGYVNIDLDAEAMGLKNNTKYYINLTGYLDWEGEQHNLRNTYSSYFYVDSEAPQLDAEKLELRVERKSDKTNKYLLDVYVYDNHYLQCMKISTYESLGMSGALEGETEFHKYMLPVDSARNMTNKITFDITEYYDLIMRNGRKLYFEFVDYAKNSSSYAVKIPRAEADEVSFRAGNTAGRIKINQYLDLKEYLECTTVKDTDDKAYSAWTDALAWSSSNEAVAIVRDGVVCGLSAGSAVITVTSPTGKSAEFALTVSEQKYSDAISLQKLKMSEARLSLRQGETHELFFEAEPWNFDDSNLTYVWSTTNEKIARVTQDPKNPKRATVTALDEGSVTVSVSAGTLITGVCTVGVEKLYDMDGAILKSYTGRGDADGVLVVPEDLGVKLIYDNAFFGNTYIKKLVLPEGVETINQSAFYGMTALEEVVLPSTVKELPKWAFGWCTSLSKINLQNVKKIGELAFYQCDLRALDIPKVVYIANNSFVANDNLLEADLSRVSFIGQQAFANCASLQRVAFSPDARIDAKAFMGCNSLTSLVLPNAQIGQFAFQGCANINSVTFTGENVRVGDGAFSECKSLSGLAFTGTVKSIGKQAFYKCALTELTLPDGLEELASFAFMANANLASVTVSAGARLTELGPFAFAGCERLTAFTVSEGNRYVTAVDGVLYDKPVATLLLAPTGKNLGAFTAPESLREIGAHALTGTYSDGGIIGYGGAKVTSAVLPNVVRVGEGAFENSLNLTSVVAPKLAHIGARAFANCASLRTLPIAEGVTRTVGDYAFAYCSYASAPYAFTLPKLDALGTHAFDGVKRFSSVTVAAGVEELPDHCFQNNTNLTEIVWNGGVSHIGAFAFAGCAQLEAVEIPASVQSMGEAAFFNCASLASLTIEEGLAALPTGAFQKCETLTNVELPSSVSGVGNFAFYGCTRLGAISLPGVKMLGDGAFIGTRLTELNAPELVKTGANLFAQEGQQTAAFRTDKTLTRVNAAKLTEIGSLAFYGCTQLTRVFVPSVKSIGAMAFEGCGLLSEIDTSSAEYFGSFAFLNAASLTEVSLGSAVSLGEGFLMGTQVSEAALSAAAADVSEGAFFGAEGLAAIAVAESNERYYALDGVLYRKRGAGSELVAYPKRKADTVFTVPENVTRIAAYAFSANGFLTELTLPRTLKYVGASAADGCGSLATYLFLSPAAPELESDYREGVELNYRNYSGPVGSVNLKMYYPENGTGYGEYLYGKIFAESECTESVLEDATVAAIAAIAALPETLTEADRALVAAARTAYDMVSKAQRGLVEDYEKLLKAESFFRVADMIAEIAALPETVASEEDAAKVEAAAERYAGLTADEQAQVTNAEKLALAEKSAEAYRSGQGEPPAGCGCGSIGFFGGPGGGTALGLIAAALAGALALSAVLLRRKKVQKAEDAHHE